MGAVKFCLSMMGFFTFRFLVFRDIPAMNDEILFDERLLT
jgi:hypothetical protein